MSKQNMRLHLLSAELLHMLTRVCERGQTFTGPSLFLFF